MIAKFSKLVLLLGAVLVCSGCGQQATDDTTKSVQQPIKSGTYFEYKVDIRKVEATSGSVSMIDTVQSLISQRLEKLGIRTAQVSKSWLDPTLMTVKLAPANTLSTAQALDLVKPLQLSFKEHPVHADDTIWQDTSLTGSQLARVSLSPTVGNPAGDFSIALDFNAEGKALFAAITKRNINKPIGIFLDDVLVSSPMVQGEITGGSAFITGSMSIKEMQQLTNGLNLGVLDIPITLQKVN